MNIDWWPLIREARTEAWKNVATIFGSVLEALGKMLTSGDPSQVIPAIIIIVSLIAGSSLSIIRLVARLARNGAIGI